MLITERLLLRRLTMEDLPAVHGILGDPEVMYAWEHGFSLEESREFLANAMRRYEQGLGHLAVERLTDGTLVGLAGLLLENMPGGQKLGIGWIFHKAHWGMGYATEAARALLCHAFGRMNADEVIADIRPENIASCRLAERLGMKAEYEIIKHYRGKDMPHTVYVVRKA